MKTRSFKRMVSLLLALAMLIGFVPAFELPVSAKEVSGAIKASQLPAGEGLVLTGHTVLNMDTNLSLAYIKGAYDLLVEGSGALTVEGSDVGIKVDNLEVQSNLHVRTTSGYAIETTGVTYLFCDALYVNGGIHASGVSIDSDDAVIAAPGQGIYAYYDIILSGKIAVGAQKAVLYAENGYIRMEGDIECNSLDDNDYCVVAGTSIYTNTSVNLKVRGGGGLCSEIGNIELSGEVIDVQTQLLDAFYAKKGTVSISATDLTVVAGMNIEEFEDYLLYNEAVYASGDVNVSVTGNALLSGAGISVYSGEGNVTMTGGGTYRVYTPSYDIFENCYGIRSGKEVILNGHFKLENDLGNCIYAGEAVTTYGSLKCIAKGTNNSGLTASIYAKRNVNLYGSTVEVTGPIGIEADAEVDSAIHIVADNASVIGTQSYGIRGNDVEALADELWVESLHDDENEYRAAIRGRDVRLSSENGGLTGERCISASRDVILDGKFNMGATRAEAILAYGRLIAEGSLVARTYEKRLASVIKSTEDFSFKGTLLDLEGGRGITSDSNVDIAADWVSVINDMGAAISGVEVYVNADNLHIENRRSENDVLLHNGISASSKVALQANAGTVIGYNCGISVNDMSNKYPDHFIYLNGDISVVGKTAAALQVTQGVAESYGTVTLAGKTYGIDAKDVYFDGSRMNVSGDTAIHATRSVELEGSDIKITSNGSTNSGISSENGDVQLTGSVVIHTNGWYGVYATDLTLNNGYYEVRGPKGNAQAVKLGGTLTMAPTLEIVDPKYGHVNGNDIYGAGDSPAMEFVIYSPIEMVDIYVSTPAAGLMPIWDATAVYGLPAHTSFESIIWYENGVEMDRNTPFTAGNTYKVKVTVAGEDGYRFKSDAQGKINGKNASTGIIYQPPQVILTASLGTCPDSISEVDLEITPPVDGKKPSTSVSAFESTYGVRSQNVSWSVSTDGTSFTSMGANEVFTAGKYYRVYMDVTTASTQYVFRITTEDGSVQPAVNATVNCSPATVIKAYDQDPEDVITVYYDFGMCNERIIKKVGVVGLQAPQAGRTPSYEANFIGTGYGLENSEAKDYWSEKYYKRSGIIWYDENMNYVYEDQPFELGKKYTVRIYLDVTDTENYEFDWDRNTLESKMTGTVNGNVCTVQAESSNASWNHTLWYDFVCTERQIDIVRINEIDEPSAGATPDYSATVAVPEEYQPDPTFGRNGIAWYNCEGMEMSSTDTFTAGETYCIAIRVTTAAGIEVASEPDFFINGKAVTAYGTWDKVVVDGNKVIAYYTFRAASAAPAVGVPVSGTVTSQGSASDPVTLQLLNFNTTTVAYQTQVSGNSASYLFEGVTAGVYTLRATKEGNVTAEYTVVVNTTPVVRDVTLMTDVLKGDVDGNGVVDMDDAIYLLFAINFPESYPLNQPANFDGVGEEDMDDAIYLLFHVNFSDSYPLH